MFAIFFPVHQQTQDPNTKFNVRVAKVKIVYEVFDSKNNLTFDTGGVLAFTKMRTGPYAAQPCV